MHKAFSEQKVLTAVNQMQKQKYLAKNLFPRLYELETILKHTKEEEQLLTVSHLAFCVSFSNLANSRRS